MTVRISVGFRCFRRVGEGRCALPVLLCQVDAPCARERQQEPERGGGRASAGAEL